MNKQPKPIGFVVKDGVPMWGITVPPCNKLSKKQWRESNQAQVSGMTPRNISHILRVARLLLEKEKVLTRNAPMLVQFPASMFRSLKKPATPTRKTPSWERRKCQDCRYWGRTVKPKIDRRPCQHPKDAKSPVCLWTSATYSCPLWTRLPKNRKGTTP